MTGLKNTVLGFSLIAGITAGAQNLEIKTDADPSHEKNKTMLFLQEKDYIQMETKSKTAFVFNVFTGMEEKENTLTGFLDVDAKNILVPEETIKTENIFPRKNISAAAKDATDEKKYQDLKKFARFF